jgi:aminopeptidase-like protein
MEERIEISKEELDEFLHAKEVMDRRKEYYRKYYKERRGIILQRAKERGERMRGNREKVKILVEKIGEEKLTELADMARK